MTMLSLAGEPWQWIALGVDVAGLYLVRILYRAAVSRAEDVEATHSYKIDEELEELLTNHPNHQLPYACIEGGVYALDKPLSSHFVDKEEGVLQKLLFVEHKSRRANGYWSDVKNVIKDQLNIRPFSLVGDVKTHGGSPLLVEVAEPVSASFLMDSLTTTYDNFTPNKDTLLSRGIDRLFGDVSKGYQETEKMLSVGVNLLGIGKIALRGGKMVLEPPSDSSKLYILSTHSKKEIIRDLRGNAHLLRVLVWIFGICGGGLIAYLLYKNIRSMWEYYKWSCVMRRIQENRVKLLAQQGSSSNSEAEDVSNAMANSNCVVCLTNPREVVLLECGHICVCADCAGLLPHPKKCPICRSSVTRLVTTYVS